MFHTFETAQYTSLEQTDMNVSAAAKRRTTTVRACEPCRRRKIRCNGEHPCETCQWYRKAASCHYTEPRQRQMPSRRSVEKISQTLQQYRGILQKLFPSVHPEQLQGLSRDKLIELISKSGPFQAPSPITPCSDHHPPSIHPDAGSLERLQTLPEDAGDEVPSERSHKALQGVSDDVNALSVSMKHSSSYLGISSVMAALRVILWLDPECQAFVNRSSNRSPSVTSAASASHEDVSRFTSTWDEVALINAYFQYVHPFIPLIDEHTFRDTYMAKQRTDSRWNLLLNTVLAMGAVAHNRPDDKTHSMYFDRAKEHLNIETLGSAHVESVQAIAILSGYYYHYTQQPDVANALMGAALRMATALGLHRDYSEGLGSTSTSKATLSIEMRRRVWWSTFLLDTWSSNTLGRPSMGRWSHAITARSPQESIGGSDTLMTLMQENIRFSIISTKMEDSLAVSPLMDETERQTLDSAFVDWFESSSVQSTTPRLHTTDAPGVTVLKNVMRWRYLLSRVILHRPVLLWYTMRKMSFEDLPEDKKAAIDLCRDATAELITDIDTTWKSPMECQMSAWNATWLIYQAVMVSLLSLFSDPLEPDVVDKSQQQVETTMSTLTELKHWSGTAARSLEVVRRIYEASRRHSPESQDHSDYYSDMDPTPVYTNIRPSYIDLQYISSHGRPEFVNTPSKEHYMDNMFDSLNWSTGWNRHDYPFVTPRAGWDHQAMTGWGASTEYDGYFNTVFTPEENIGIGVSGDLEYDVAPPDTHAHAHAHGPGPGEVPVNQYRY